MIPCIGLRPLSAATFLAAFVSIVITDISKHKAVAAPLFDPATALEMRAATPRPPVGGTMREALGRSRGAETVVRDRLVRLNTGELERIVPAGADHARDRLARARSLGRNLRLDLFSGVSVTAQRTDIEAPEEGGYVWTGEDAGMRPAFVTLVINNNEVTGQVQRGGRLYSIDHVSGRLHRIVEIDQNKIRDDQHAPPLPDFFRRMGESTKPPPDLAGPRAATAIRLLVAHTRSARLEIGTASKMQARINLAIALANQAFIRSGIFIRFVRVGGATEVNYNEAAYYGGLNTSNNYLGVLCDLSDRNCSGWVTNHKRHLFRAVRNKRESTKADLVALMRKQGAHCGQAWLPRLNGFIDPLLDHVYGYSVSTVTPAYRCVEAHVLAHETGHNMGMNHDRVQHRKDYFVSVPPPSEFNFGHVNKRKKFFTIMSYFSNCPGCTRIPYFSTPLRRYPAKGGSPVGVAQGVGGLYGAADARRLLNTNRAKIASYR